MPSQEPYFRRDPDAIERLRRHFQLDKPNHGGVGVGNRAQMSANQRKEEDQALDGFPPLPEAEKWRLESIIATYGLPLESLDSTTAAFIVKRVLRDYYRITRKGRSAKPLFTLDELQTLMTELNVDFHGLAEMAGALPPKGSGKNNNLIYRWLRGLSAPTGHTAFRINSLIERHVRRKGVVRQVSQRPSTKPATVERRTRLRVAQQRKEALAPVSQLTGKEPTDANGEGGRD